MARCEVVSRRQTLAAVGICIPASSRIWLDRHCDCLLVPDTSDLPSLFYVLDRTHHIGILLKVFNFADTSARSDGNHSTVQFVGISAFHTRVSDPLIGGTYMTVRTPYSNLNTMD